MTWALEPALRASVLLAAGLLATASLHRRSAALRHVVLAMATVGALLVLPLQGVLPRVSLLPASPLATTSGSADAVATAALPSVPAHATAAPPSTHPVLPASLYALSSAVVPVAWTLGTLGALCVLLVSTARLARLTASASRIRETRWTALAADVAAAHGLRTVPALLIVGASGLLGTWGWLRPVVLVPDEALGWSDARVRAVLAHELAHVARRDWVVQLLAEVLRALLWWNPLAWLLCRRLRQESEQACDDAVLRLGVAPRTYAGELVAIARACRGPAGTWQVALPMSRIPTLERRVAAMLNPHLDRTLPSPWTRLAAVLVVGGLTLSAATLRGAQGPQPLEGIVFDQTGAVLPGVPVTLEDAQARSVTATTDASGRFSLQTVDAGRYTLQVRVPGFKQFRESVELKSAADWDRVIMLPIGSVQETLTVRSSRSAPAAAAADRPAPVRVGGNIRPPRKLVDVKPVFPQSMKEAGREAVVQLEAIIGIDGHVSAVRVVSTQAHPDFALAAADAVRRWRFAPTLLNGTPVEVAMGVSIAFDLED